MPAGTLIDISPVLLFSSEEYVHAKKTIVDEYSFVWNVAGKSLMALPLGLGELCMRTQPQPPTLIVLGAIFNHSREPNVTYRLDKQMNTIEYTTTKRILTGQELCIYYGSDDKLWFPMENSQPRDTVPGSPTVHAPESIWDEIAPLVTSEPTITEELVPAVTTDPVPSSITPSQKPVFQRIKVLSAEELEEAEGMPVSTSESCYLFINKVTGLICPQVDVWAVDVELAPLLKSLMEYGSNLSEYRFCELKWS